MTHSEPPETHENFLLYTTASGDTRVECRIQNETIWLSQKLLAELFLTSKQNIGQHLQNIFLECELNENSVVKEFFTTASDGKNYRTKFYNLDTIIAVGYRVKRGIVMKMTDWIGFLQNFLELSNYPILTDNGSITAEKAKIKAECEYNTFRKQQDVDYRSDFDHEIEQEIFRLKEQSAHYHAQNP